MNNNLLDGLANLFRPKPKYKTCLLGAEGHLIGIRVERHIARKADSLMRRPNHLQFGGEQLLQMFCRCWHRVSCQLSVVS